MHARPGEPVLAQHAQVARDGWLGDAELGDDLGTDRSGRDALVSLWLVVVEQLEDPATDRITEDVERVHPLNITDKLYIAQGRGRYPAACVPPVRRLCAFADDARRSTDLGRIGLTTRVSDARRILVVDDESSIVDAVATALRYEGYDVTEATTGRAGLTLAQSARPDLIVLDVMLPDIDGYGIARRIRADGLTMPILFLTAKDTIDDKVLGFNAGGDDYVTKPFSLAEIVLRVRAILQRSMGSFTEQTSRLSFSDLVLDQDSREVWRSGQPIEMTATEFNLLRFFMLNPRRVLSKPQILDHVWHYDFDGDTNILETYISYVRKKLNALGPPLIQTVRLVGYVLRETESEDA